MSEIVTTTRMTQLTRPIASPQEVISYHNDLIRIVKEALSPGVDYGVIPGTNKESLFKAGAERMCIAFGCHVEYELTASEIDHNREVVHRKGTSYGFYKYVYKAKIVKNADGQVIGECHGLCSTIESKYIARPRDSENTVLKMAQKRAFVGAVLHAFGLSDRFTQDTEDNDEPHREAPRSSPRPAQVEEEREPVIEQPAVELFNKDDLSHLSRLNKLLEDKSLEFLELMASRMHGERMTRERVAELAASVGGDQEQGDENEERREGGTSQENMEELQGQVSDSGEGEGNR